MVSVILVIQSSIYIYPKGSKEQVKREKQILTALRSLIQYNEFIIKSKIDVIFYDNSCTELTDNFSKIIPENFEIVLVNNNVSGKINKGVGLIEGWKHLSNQIEKYEWIIHFESRLFTRSLNFYEQFIKYPDTYFRRGPRNEYFFTGLFSMKTKDLLNYIMNEDIKFILIEHIEGRSLEERIYNYCMNNCIKVNICKALCIRRNYYDPKHRGIKF